MGPKPSSLKPKAQGMGRRLPDLRRKARGVGRMAYGITLRAPVPGPRAEGRGICGSVRWAQGLWRIALKAMDLASGQKAQGGLVWDFGAEGFRPGAKGHAVLARISAAT
eukprot:2641170-Pyramimonas_sp.AAC.2